MHVAKHLVDGLDICDPVSARPTIYEFPSCYGMAVLAVFLSTVTDIPSSMPITPCKRVYEHTLRKHDLLRQHGYDLKVKWECDWDIELKTKEDLARFLNAFKIVEPVHTTVHTLPNNTHYDAQQKS